MAELEDKDLYFKTAMAVKVLNEVMRYRVEREVDSNRSYADGTVAHLARLDAWTGRVVTTMKIEVGRGVQPQTLN